MDELQAELAADIEAMDLGTEAAESGKATIQGFVSGAEAMLPQVQAAYSRIAQAAIDAIDAKLRKELQTRIREIHLELGLTTVFVTHDQDEAMVMSDVIELFHAGRIEQAGSPVSVYTKPVSTFAASFIGSYNQIDGTTFYQATRLPIEAGNTVAIRPETISISTEEPADKTGSIILRGTITASVPRGNVLRYKIEAGGMEIVSDTLFRSRALFAKGDRVHITIMNRNCIRL